jgi:hypothetical protein
MGMRWKFTTTVLFLLWIELGCDNSNHLLTTQGSHTSRWDIVELHSLRRNGDLLLTGFAVPSRAFRSVRERLGYVSDPALQVVIRQSATRCEVIVLSSWMHGPTQSWGVQRCSYSMSGDLVRVTTYQTAVGEQRYQAELQARVHENPNTARTAFAVGNLRNEPLLAEWQRDFVP